MGYRLLCAMEDGMDMNEEEWRARLDGVKRMNKHCQDGITCLTRENDELKKLCEEWKSDVARLIRERDEAKRALDMIRRAFDELNYIHGDVKRERDEARRQRDAVAADRKALIDGMLETRKRAVIEWAKANNKNLDFDWPDDPDLIDWLMSERDKARRALEEAAQLAEVALASSGDDLFRLPAAIRAISTGETTKPQSLPADR